MKTISIEKAEAERRRLVDLICHRDQEANKLREAAKSGPAKYYHARMQNAKEAEREARRLRGRLEELDRIVAQARQEGRVAA